MGKISLPNNTTIFFEGEAGEVSDSYHTFNELYAHRCLLFAALMLNANVPAWCAEADSTGKALPGWFLAGMELAPGQMITYHLPDHLWPLFDGTRVVRREYAPPWDGHTSDDVIHRLTNWCSTFTGGGVSDDKQIRAGQDAGESGDGSIQEEVCEDPQTLPESLQEPSATDAGPRA